MRRKSEKQIWKKKSWIKEANIWVCLCLCDTHRSVDLHNHFSSGFVAFAVVGPFLFLLQHAVSGGSVLQGKLADDFTEPVDTDLPHTVGWMSEEQQKWMEPGKNEKAYPQHTVFLSSANLKSLLYNK